MYWFKDNKTVIKSVNEINFFIFPLKLYTSLTKDKSLRNYNLWFKSKVLSELVEELLPEFQQEVRDFLEFLLEKRGYKKVNFKF